MAERLPEKVSAKELATLLGVTVRWIQQLTKDGVLTAVKTKSHRGGQFVLQEAVQQYIHHQTEKQSSSKNSKQALDEARIAKLELERQALEMKVQIQAGEVHTTQDVEMVMADMLGAFRARLWNLPQTVAPKLEGVTEESERKSILKGEIHEVCNLLMKYNSDDFYRRNPQYQGRRQGDDEAG